MVSTCVTKFLNYFYILKGVHKPSMWRYIPEIQILERMKQENYTFEGNLGYTAIFVCVSKILYYIKIPIKDFPSICQ